MKWQGIVFNSILLAFFSITISKAEAPPLAVFAFSDTSYNNAKQQYGLPCKNNIIPQDGVKTIAFQNSRTQDIFSLAGQTPHNESINIKCKTEEGYYESALASDSFAMKCENGIWKNTSICVRKCVFTKNEFNQEDIVKGRDVSAQSTTAQYKIENFESAMRKGTKSLIAERNSQYYANVGEDIDIYCPEGYAPFTSETTVMQSATLANNSFSTKCLTETTPQQNKWSVLMACYNGFKPCNNTEIKVQSGGIKICNNIGDCFNEFGGEKRFPNGKTPHGGKLEMNCGEPWYKHFDYTSPTCKDGTWVSKKTGISPKIAYCEAAYCETDNEILGYAWSKQVLYPGEVIAEKKKRVYYGQNYQFQCQRTNRVNGNEGKVFKCNFSPQDEISVVEVQQDNWFYRYCLSNKACTNAAQPWFDSGESEHYTAVTKHINITGLWTQWAWTECGTKNLHRTTWECKDDTCSRRDCKEENNTCNYIKWQKTCTNGTIKAVTDMSDIIKEWADGRPWCQTDGISYIYRYDQGSKGRASEFEASRINYNPTRYEYF